jgi:type IV secretory pathway VirB2 component (pilin)
MSETFLTQIKQINTRFKIFGIAIIALSITQIVQNFPNYSSNFGLSYSQSILQVLFGLIAFFVAIIYVIFFGMLVHGVFTHLKDKYKLESNPTLVTVFSLVPIVSNILFPLEIIKAYKALKLESTIAQSYFYFNIASLVLGFVIFVVQTSYAIKAIVFRESVGSLSNVDSGRVYTFDILSSLLSLAVMIFTWFIFKKIVDSINTIRTEDDIVVEVVKPDLVVE